MGSPFGTKKVREIEQVLVQKPQEWFDLIYI